MAKQSTQNLCGEIAQDQLITPIEAACYIKDFWQNQQCRRFGLDSGAGNFIPYTLDSPFHSLFLSEVFGISIYPCISGRFFDSLFITLKAARVCPDENPSSPIQDNEQLIQSNVRIGKFDEIDYRDENSMLAALRRLKYDISYKIPDPLYGHQVKAANDRYINRFDAELGYVNSGFGFVKADDLVTFLNQGGRRALGFYVMLGLSNTLSRDRIRIILIAIDSEGRPLLNDGHLCMEKSWPPIQ